MEGSPAFVMMGVGRIVFGPTNPTPLTSPPKDVRVLPSQFTMTNAAEILSALATHMESMGDTSRVVEEIRWTPDQLRQIATALRGK